MWQFWIDRGGTFTDIVARDPDGSLSTHKLLSENPERYKDAAIAGIKSILGVAPEAPIPDGLIEAVKMGTTVATNALLERKGDRVLLLVNKGFADALRIGNQARPRLFDLAITLPTMLYERVSEVGGRVGVDGAEIEPLDESLARDVLAQARADGINACAIVLMHAWKYPAHEQRLADLASKAGFTQVSASHAVSPLLRLVPRGDTTVVDAYLSPILRRYVDQVAGELPGTRVYFMQSNGGLTTSETFQGKDAILSGPAGGIVGAARTAGMAGLNQIIGFDMGGTSTDVALLKAGEARLASEAIVHGHPIKAPMLDIHTVGAGGGSIAYVDSGGLLKVGPRSAGADPGPVCYGKGNAEPTVTDANLVLQTLNPHYLLGGRMPVRQDLAKNAIGKLAQQLGLGLMQTAQGIISVVTANMAKAIRVISVQRGHDPRDYTLMAFGGAGPLHAARLARELDIKRILVPRNPGILCAMGLLLTDLRADFAATRLLPLEPGVLGEIESAFAALNTQAEAWFAHEEIAADARRLLRTVDMRYAGQNYELAIPLPDGPITPKTLDVLAQGFADAHQRMYGFLADNEPVQLVTFRLEATGLVSKATLKAHPAAGEDASHAIRESRDVWLAESGDFVACPVYAREELKSGNRFSGPAIVEQMDATTVVLPGMNARVDPYLNLILEVA
jgi:N-methylhydantoinase A